MIVRRFREDDINQIIRIHQNFYQDEFSMDDFCRQYAEFWVVEDEGQIVTAGGVRLIAEAVIITDKDQTVKNRRDALHQMLEVLMYSCGVHKMDQLHAFIQDPTWEKQLKKAGFVTCKGNALVLGVK